MRLLSKQIDDIINDGRMIINSIIGFTETQINPLDLTCKIIETLNLSLTSVCRIDVNVSNKFDANEVFTFGFTKHNFANRVLILILVYTKESSSMQEFS